jgi:hypothetical protein
MPTASRVAVAACVLCLAVPGAARAAGRSDPDSKSATLVSDLLRLVSDVSTFTRAPRQSGPVPQPIPAAPPGSPELDLNDLSKPPDLEARLRTALHPTDGVVRITIPGGTARLGDYTIGTGEQIPGHLLVVQGDADVYGRLLGNLVTVQGDVVVHNGGVVVGDILAFNGHVRRDSAGEIGGEVRTLQSASALTATAAPPAEPPPSTLETLFRRGAGAVGVFLTLGVLGFGLVMFGRQNLEVVSDTVSHSFGRSFLTGLLGQILLLPTFGMLVVGLVLSVAGILLLPFAVAVYALLVVVGVLGGYLAVAHAMGETYVRRRMALGQAMGSPNSYRYMFIGLGALAAFWIAWAVFGWVPVAGNLIRAVAVLVSWLLATAGFGAALLSRAGIRESFAGRLLPPEALTDEYLWATPQFGVQAARRPGSRTPTRGL